MRPTPDEVAGVVDLFGGLTRTELREALAELGFRSDGEYDPESFDTAIDAAVTSYHLVTVEDDSQTEAPLLVAGPVAFPTLPQDAQDLPHMLDIERREIDRDRATDSAVKRFRDDAEKALRCENETRIVELLDVSYELETWGNIDLSEIRNRLDQQC